jgi:hypothetical protein
MDSWSREPLVYEAVRIPAGARICSCMYRSKLIPLAFSMTDPRIQNPTFE